MAKPPRTAAETPGQAPVHGGNVRVPRALPVLPVQCVRSLRFHVFSRESQKTLALVAARVWDLNETLDGSLQIAVENGSPRPQSTTAVRLRTRVSDLRSDLRTDQRFRTDARESGTLAGTLGDSRALRTANPEGTHGHRDSGTLVRP